MIRFNVSNERNNSKETIETNQSIFTCENDVKLQVKTVDYSKSTHSKEFLNKLYEVDNDAVDKAKMFFKGV